MTKKERGKKSAFTIFIRAQEKKWYVGFLRQCPTLEYIYCCSVAKLCPALCDPMDCSTPGFPVLHCLPEFVQIDVCSVGEAVQPSHPLSPLPPLTIIFSQHQGIFQSVGSSHQVAEVLEFQLQHQSFQWTCVCIYIHTHTYIYFFSIYFEKYIYIYFFRFFSMIGYYNMASIAPCAVQ